MIEVEKKFLLTRKEQEVLLLGAEKISVSSEADIYFDYPDWRLTCSDIWLRERNGRPEVKIPITGNGRVGSTDRYREIDSSSKEVLTAVGISFEDGLNFQGHLFRDGLVRIADIITNRSKYRKDGFTIDVDDADFGNGEVHYSIVEVELLVGDESEAQMAEDRIFEFARCHGILPTKHARGKLIEYICRYRREHFSALLKAGVVSHR